MTAANQINLELAFFVGIFTGVGAWILSYLITIGISKFKKLGYEFNPMVWIPVFCGAMPMCISATIVFVLIAYVSATPVPVMAITTLIAVAIGTLIPIAFLKSRSQNASRINADSGQLVLSVYVLNIVVGIMSFGTSLFWIR